jgi:hypothetical protein
MADLDSGGNTDAAEPASAAFEQAAARAARRRTGPVGEFAYFLRRTRKYWLVPVIVSLLLTGLFAVGGGSVVAPLIYALF